MPPPPPLPLGTAPAGEPRTQLVASTHVATCGEEEELETRCTWLP